MRHPERTLFLSAPLQKSCGGTESCQGAVYADPTDPDYTAVFRLVAEAVERAWEHPRRDLQSLVEISATPPP